MADKKKDETVPGFSGSAEEGKGPSKTKEKVSKDAVISDVGATEPSQVFEGDGVTPKK